MAGLFLAIAATLLGQAAPPAQQPKPEISDKEALDFCRKLEQGVLDGKPEAFNDAAEVSAIIETAIFGLDLKPEDIRLFRTGVTEKFSLGKMLIPSTGNSYRFLGLRTVGTHRGPMFRLWGAEGLNYHVFKLRKTPAGVIRIVDLFVFSTGDWMSAVLRQGAKAVLAQDPAGRAALDPRDLEFADNILEFREFQRAAGAGDHAKALELFAALPEGVRNMHIAQCVRLKVASQAGEVEFLKAEAEFRKLFPDHFSTDFFTMDAWVYRKDYRKALASIDGIERKAGGDPLLNYLRGNMFFCLEKLEEAKKAARQASMEVPYVQEPRWLLVTIALREKAHAETVQLLTALERDFKLVMENFESVEDYADFVKSAEYREWKKSRAPK